MRVHLTYEKGESREDLGTIRLPTLAGQKEVLQRDRRVRVNMPNNQEMPKEKHSWIDWLDQFLDQIVLLAIGLGVSAYLEFGIIYCIFVSFGLIYYNTSTEKKKGQLSAYSVFNPDLKPIAGTVTAQQIEDMLRR
jgi:hypothetical protein